jgi:predicted component of type VI protein secretion system
MGLHAYDDSTLSRVSNLREVIGYLLDPDAEQAERLNDLKRAFAGFALHQVAILGASVEGARELLDSLSPGSMASPEGALSSSGSAITIGRQRLPAFFMNLWPVAPLVSWNRYKRHYEMTAEGDRFTQKLFGRKFVRAYLALVGSQETR